MENTENTLIDAAVTTDTTDVATETTTETQAVDTTAEATVQGTGAYAAIPAAELGMPIPEPEPAPVLVIAPSVGRKVHFYPGNVQFHSQPYCINPEVPMDATVVYVWSDRMVNLHVVDHIGQVHALTSVTLRQPDDVIAEGAAYAEWMPFQVGQVRASV